MKISHDAGAETAQRQPVATRSEQSPVGRAAVQSSTPQLQADIDRSPHLLAQRRALDAAFGGAALQRQADGLEDDEPLQARVGPVAQLATLGDEDELPLQGRFESEGSSAGTAQRQADMLNEEDEPPLQARMDEAVSQRTVADEDDKALLQGRFEGAAVQRMEGASGSGDTPDATAAVPVAALNQTGMPNQLKAGIESLSGVDMSDVRVHRNSDKPAQLNALAYAQGNDIHLGPGQEQHLPHEAWHVVQQRQGRVRETVQMAGVGVNDEVGLEREADLMGERAASPLSVTGSENSAELIQEQSSDKSPVQRVMKGVLEDLTAEQLNELGSSYGLTDAECIQIVNKFDQLKTEKMEHWSILQLIERVFRSQKGRGNKAKADLNSAMQDEAQNAALKPSQTATTLTLFRGDTRPPDEVKAAGGLYGRAFVPLSHARLLAAKFSKMEPNARLDWAQNWKAETKAKNESYPYVATGSESQKAGCEYKINVPLRRVVEGSKSQDVAILCDSDSVDTATVICLALHGPEYVFITGIPAKFIVFDDGSASSGSVGGDFSSSSSSSSNQPSAAAGSSSSSSK